METRGQSETAGPAEPFGLRAGDLTTLAADRLAAAEAALAQRQQQIDDIFALTGMGGWHWVPGGANTYISPEARLLLGISPDVPLQMGDFSGRFGPEGQAALRAALKRTWETGQPFDLELDATRLDGTPIRLRGIGRLVTEHWQPLRVTGTIQDVTADYRRRQKEAFDLRMRDAVNAIQGEFIKGFTAEAFSSALEVLCELSGSEYGYIGEVLREDDGTPWLRTYAVSDISWDQHSRDHFEAHRYSGMVFRNMNTLFGQSMVTGSLFIANDAPNHPKRGGLPSGHPGLRAFAGIPLFANGVMVAQVGLANRVGGYDEAFIDSLKPMLDALSALIATEKEVKARRATEAALAHERARLATIIDSTETGTWEWNVQTGETWFNERWASMLGYTLEELQPTTIETCSRLRHPDDLDGGYQTGQRDYATKEHQIELEVRMRHKDGHYVWILDRGRVVSWTEDGKPLMMVGTHQDISERKNFELQLASVTNRLKLAIEASAVGIWDINVETGVMTWDDRIYAIYGTTREALGEQIPAKVWQGFIHPDDRERAVQEVIQSAVAGDGRGSSYRILTPDGEERHIFAAARTITGPDGDHKVLGICRDITAEVRLNQELDAKRSEAEAASIAKSDFLATMSHEIRTPMNGVIGMLEVLLRSGLEGEQKEQAAVALKSARNLLHVLNDILDVSKLEARQVELDIADFDPCAVVEDVYRLFESTASDKGIELEAEAEASVPAVVRGDEARLRQVLTNLVGNAVKFTPHGTVAIHLGYEAATSELSLTVRDSGIGIPAEARERLFNRFSQADSTTTRKFGGTGLGLAICRQLTELMGGSIGFESQPGEGSTFWIKVPAPVGSADAIPIRPAAVGDDTAESRPLRILVAEDNETNQRILTALLSPQGHQLTVVANGAEAVSAARREAFDVILMDVQMPVMDGMSATRLIREMPGALRHIPIIALTANALAGDRERYLASGMTDYVAKPITVPDLFAALDRAGRAAALPTENAA